MMMSSAHARVPVSRVPNVCGRALSTQPRIVPRTRARCLLVLAHGPSGPAGHGGSTMVKGEKDKGFVREMRTVAMKLHTRDQSPKEGKQEAAPKPRMWEPKLEGYLRFLVESKAVYDVLESVVADKEHPEYAAFCSTGLERSKALEEDIKWYTTKYSLPVPAVREDGPGAAYAQKMKELSKTDAPAFICHLYNFYFAHTAGGRMIGSKVGQMLLDSHELNFYKYEGDMSALLDNVRKSINEISETWSAEQKQHCLAETTESFKSAGKIMECITE